MKDPERVLTSLEYRPRLPANRRHGIGLIGAGRIARIGHLPAYRAAGFNVVAVASRSRESADEVAREWGIPRVHDSWQALLDDPAVEVVDVAYPPHLNPEIARAALEVGKPALLEKPLACSFEDALALAEQAERQALPLAVMQNGRWDPSARAVRHLLAAGVLGEPRLGMVHVRRHIKTMSYYLSDHYDQILVLNTTVHHFDTFRMFFGQPERVWASLSGYPDQPFPGETLATYCLEYPGGLQASGIENGWIATPDQEAWFRIDGTAGTVLGTLGYAVEGPARLKLLLGEREYSPQLEGSWFPDSFAGPMADLLCALEEGRPPETGLRDNLETLRIVFAAYRAAREKRAVAPGEIG